MRVRRFISQFKMTGDLELCCFFVYDALFDILLVGMPLLNENAIFKKYLMQSEAKALAYIEFTTTAAKQKRHDIFLEQTSQFERSKDVDIQKNKAERDEAIKKINQRLKSLSPKTWSDYKAAESKKMTEEQTIEARYAQEVRRIHEEYNQKKEDNTHDYQKEIAHLEHRGHAQLSAVSRAYAPVYKRQKHQYDKAMMSYLEACEIASSLYQSSASEASHLFQKKSEQAHAEAIKARHVEAERLQVGSPELLKISYEIAAGRLGFDGIMPDVLRYVSKDSPYDSIQPLLGYIDLKSALDDATKQPEKSDIIRHFYDVTGDDPNINAALLKDAVQFLDANAFSALMTSTDGLKAHAIKAIATYNQGLKHPDGVGDLRLTKRHIMASRDQTLCVFDETPYYQKSEAYRQQASEIDACYRAQCKVLKKTYEEVTQEAKRLEQDTWRQASAVLASTAEDIERDFEWDILEAELSVHLKALHYFSHPENCTALLTQTQNHVDVNKGISDIPPTVETPKQKKKPVFFQPNKRFGPPKYHQIAMSRIPENEVVNKKVNDEYVMDDDDREVCRIMGVR